MYKAHGEAGVSDEARHERPFSAAEHRDITDTPDLEGLSVDDAVDAIREWFFVNFEDPAQRTPYESAEGGYIYIWGGPWDTSDIIDNMFSEYPENIREAAINELGHQDWTAASNRQIPPFEPDLEDLEQSHSVLQSNLATLKDDLEKLEQNLPAGMGHNNPPEPIEALPLDDEDRKELRAAIQVLEAQPVVPESIDEAKQAVGTLIAKEEKVQSWAKRLGIIFTEEFVKEFGKQSAQAVALALKVGLSMAVFKAFLGLSATAEAAKVWLNSIMPLF